MDESFYYVLYDRLEEGYFPSEASCYRRTGLADALCFSYLHEARRTAASLLISRYHDERGEYQIRRVTRSIEVVSDDDQGDSD